MRPGLTRELSVAVELAETAGRAVMAMRGKAAVRKKAGGEPVTEADLEANRIILEGLAKEFPRDAILSEETPSDPMRRKNDRVWIVDPIDGTREFIDGTADFAVQIGLAIEGVPVLGVVYQVARRRLYLASEGQGAFVEDPETRGRARRALVTGGETVPSNMTMTVSRFHRTKKNDAIIAAVKPIAIVPAGSIGVKMGLVSMGKVDLYLHPSKLCAEWDTCGPAAILIEAGGAVTDFFGAPLRYNEIDPHHPRGIAASNGKAHDAVLGIVAPILGTLGF